MHHKVATIYFRNEKGNLNHSRAIKAKDYHRKTILRAFERFHQFHPPPVCSAPFWEFWAFRSPLITFRVPARAACITCMCSERCLRAGGSSPHPPPLVPLLSLSLSCSSPLPGSPSVLIEVNARCSASASSSLLVRG